MEALIQHLIVEVKAAQKLEWVGAFFGVVSVLFAQRNHILLYPSGLVSTAVYAYLLSRREAGLYAEALLNVYYFIMTIYGWWYWRKQKGSAGIEISICNKKDWISTICIVVGLWVLFYFLLLKTPSAVPVWDSIVSAAACAGMWLLARRKVENWLLLNSSNLISIPLFFYKQLYVTTLLTIILFVVAVFGYFHWRSLYRFQKIK